MEVAKSTAKTNAVAKGAVREQLHERRGRRAVGVREELEELKQVGALGICLRNALRQTPSWLVSLIFHMALMLVLALIYVGEGGTDDNRLLTVMAGEEERLDELDALDDELLDLPPLDLSSEVVAVDLDAAVEQLDLSPTDDMETAPMAIELSDFGIQHAPRSDLLAQLGAMDGQGYGGRASAADRRRLGATGASEAAVARALEWFARHQLPDGGWSFHHPLAGACRGQCGNPGTMPEARNAATALALLPFLGAGQTHREGKYRKQVQAGLYYLVNNMRLSREGGSLWEDGGRLYSHGMAAIALAEAYGMTQDRALLQPTQAVVSFTCHAQDPVGGGWRYTPREKGDTSALGWQLMALKSAHMSYLQVPPEVIRKASLFLDTAQSPCGSRYGYFDAQYRRRRFEAGEGHGTTAIGLLCRMYLGWTKDHPALQRGVEFLSESGVSQGGNMYYNYYATQVARHWGGDVWKKWNDQMHDWLVNSQVKEGCQSGSWFFPGGDHGAERGGRHYCTAMATMMLEVYYRHMPIYRQAATDDDFAL